MPEISQQEREQRDRGERAESVAAWYFRLNGFLSIPGFVVHRRPVADLHKAKGHGGAARSELGALAGSSRTVGLSQHSCSQ